MFGTSDLFFLLLVVVKECIRLNEVPVLVGVPLSIEEQQQQDEEKQTQTKTSSPLAPAKKYKPSISEKEHLMVYKKKDAGDLYVEVVVDPLFCCLLFMYS